MAQYVLNLLWPQNQQMMDPPPGLFTDGFSLEDLDKEIDDSYTEDFGHDDDCEPDDDYSNLTAFQENTQITWRIREDLSKE